MFYSQFILAKKGPLGTIWIAAHLERKLRKNQVADTDIGVSVDSILFPDVPIALRLSSHLLLGVVRIYSRKVNYLFDDCSEALLKIKQAFRSTAVDLPPEESTAPYHSITLPETFDLDDFELPDNDIFQGNFIDHHVSSRDQITLQDTMDGVVYSTSQFGLDERFGDGDTSGLDLDEELFLKKVEVVEINGALLNSDADPQSSARPMTYHQDDENYEMVENSEMMATSSNLNQIEDIGEDADVIEYAQAPCTPGLLEEPNFPKIQATSACDDHLESDNHNLTEFALKENQENASSKSSLYLENRNEIDGSLMSDVKHNPVLLKENGSLTDMNPNPVISKENGSLADDTEPNQTNQQEKSSPITATISSSSGDQIKAKTMAPYLSDKTLAASDVLNRVDDMQNAVLGNYEAGGHSDDKSREDCVEFQESRLGESNQPALDEFLVHNQAALRPEQSNDIKNEGDILKSVSNGDALKPHVESLHSIPHLENPENQDIGEKSNNLAEMNPSVHENGVCILLNTGDDGSLDGNLHTDVPGTCPVETSGREEVPCALKSSTAAQDEGYHGTGSSKQVGNQIAVGSQLENTDGYVGSDLPSPEKLLSVPEVGLQKNLFVTDTPYQSKDQTDGDIDATLTVSGKKRSYTESSLMMQSPTSIQSSGTVQRKTTPESVPDDDDLLSSILVGRKSSALKVKDTPLPDMSLKRHRSAPRTSNKRKVLVDETMVLHGDMIRQQLTNTEDIRRVRKKAPCTRPEILMIQKQFLEDEIFSETIFTGVSTDFSSLHNQTYDLSATIITTKDENNVSSEVLREPTQPRSLEEEFSAFLEASNRTNVSVEPHFTRESGTAGNASHMEFTGNDEAHAVEIPVMVSGLEEHTIILDPTNDVVDTKSSQEPLGEKTEMQIDGKSISDVDVVNRDVTVDVVNTVDMTAVLVQLGSSDKTSDLDAQQINAPALIDHQLPVEIDADAYTEKKDDVDGVEHAFRITDEVLPRESEDGASVEVGADIQTGGLSTMFSPEMGECNTVTVTVDHAMEDVGQTVVGEDSFLETEVDYNAKNLVTDGFCGEKCIIDSSHPEETNADFDNVFDGQTSFFDDASQLDTVDMGVFPSDPVDRNDFDYSAAGNATEFLNYDDDDDEEAEADDEGAPSAAETRFIENSGWSSRTRAVAKYLQTVFVKEPEGKKIILIDNLLVGKSRKEASRMFFEALVLKTKDYIHVEQTSPFNNINILPRSKLIKSDF